MAMDTDTLNRMQMQADRWKVTRVEITEDRLFVVYDSGKSDMLRLTRYELCELMKVALQEAG